MLDLLPIRYNLQIYFTELDFETIDVEDMVDQAFGLKNTEDLVLGTIQFDKVSINIFYIFSEELMTLGMIVSREKWKKGSRGLKNI